MDIKKLTLEELTKAKAYHLQEADTHRHEAKAIAAEIQLRLNVAEFEKMPDAKKAALLQVLGAKGIPSGEAVGKPKATK